MQPASEANQDRLVLLEARLRNTRVLVAVILAALTISTAFRWLGWGTMRARRVEIADGDGTVRMVLDASKGPHILLYGLSGQESIAIKALDESRSAIQIGGQANALLTSSSLLFSASDSRVVLSANENRATFQLFGDDKEVWVNAWAGGETAGLDMRGNTEIDSIKEGSH